MGLRDAAALAEILVQARAEGRDVGDEFTLAQFESWRKFDNTALTHACDVFNKLFSATNNHNFTSGNHLHLLLIFLVTSSMDEKCYE